MKRLFSWIKNIREISILGWIKHSNYHSNFSLVFEAIFDTTSKRKASEGFTWRRSSRGQPFLKKAKSLQTDLIFFEDSFIELPWKVLALQIDKLSTDQFCLVKFSMVLRLIMDHRLQWLQETVEMVQLHCIWKVRSSKLLVDTSIVNLKHDTIKVWKVTRSWIILKENLRNFLNLR